MRLKKIEYLTPFRPTFLRSCFFSLIVSFLLGLPSFSQDKLCIPVYFVTDRALDTAASEMNYGDTQLEQVNCGVKNIVLTGKGLSENVTQRSAGLGWWTPISGDSKPLISSKTLREEELLKSLKEIVDDGDSSRPLILLIHGCCQPYKTSIDAAAHVEQAFESPVLLYSWCSIGPTEKFYRDNELRQRGGYTTFYRFLSRLEKVVSPERIVIIAHSMGNRFLHEALLNRQVNNKDADLPKFRQVIFAAADVNAGDFSRDQKNVSKNCEILNITQNQTDPALTLSNIQRGIYPRLGASAWVLNKLVANATGDIYDIHHLYRGNHALPIPILVDLVRGSEGAWRKKYGYFQLKPHYFEVR